MKKSWSVAVLIAACSAMGTIVPFSLSTANTVSEITTLEQLSLDEQTELENGKIVVTGMQGQYVARMLVDASVDDLWSVLTDYNNFSEFLPNIISSQVLEAEGNKYIVEQVSKQRILLFNIEARWQTENIQTEKERIDFRLVDGDLSLLQGYWKIEPIASSDENTSPQLLLTQSVAVQPERGTPEELFYNLFQNALENTLTAIRDEVDRRKMSE